jgi:hypothetical protein
MRACSHVRLSVLLSPYSGQTLGTCIISLLILKGGRRASTTFTMAPPPPPLAANLAADTRPVPASRSCAPAPAPAHSRLWKAPFQNPPRPPPRPPRDLAHGHPCPRDPCPRRAMPSRRGSVAAARARSPPAPAMPTHNPPPRSLAPSGPRAACLQLRRRRRIKRPSLHHSTTQDGKL